MKSGESRSLKEKLMKLEQKIMEYPGLQDFTGGVCQESILMAQKALEVAFPISYRWFLMTFGMGSFGDLEIFGLVEAEKGLQKKRGAPDLLFMTERLRSLTGLPHGYLPVCGDGFSSYYCIRADQEERWDAEMYVWNMEKVLLEPVALGTDVVDFLSSQLEEAIEREKEQEYFSL